MSQQPPNFPPQPFQLPKEIANLPPELQSKFLLSLQNQGQFPGFQKQSRPQHQQFPDLAELPNFPPQKKLKTENNPLGSFPNPQMMLQSFGNMNLPPNKQLELLMQKELMQKEALGGMPDQWNQRLDNSNAQGQRGGLPNANRNQMNQGNPLMGSLDQSNPSGLPFGMPDLSYLEQAGLGGQDPRLLKQAEALGLPNELMMDPSTQALKNMLLLQSLQGQGAGGDLLTNRFLQAQHQMNLLNQQQLQASQALRGGNMFNNMNPLMAYQLLENQKRMQNEYLALQAQALQMPPRMLNNQGMFLPEMMEAQRQMEASGLGRSLKIEDLAQFDPSMKEQALLARMQQNDEAERQARRRESVDQSNRGMGQGAGAVKSEHPGLPQRDNRILDQQKMAPVQKEEKINMNGKKQEEAKLPVNVGGNHNLVMNNAMENVNKAMKLEKEVKQEGGFRDYRKDPLTKEKPKNVREEPPVVQKEPPRRMVEEKQPKQKEGRKPNKLQDLRQKQEFREDDGDLYLPPVNTSATRSQRYQQRVGEAPAPVVTNKNVGLKAQKAPSLPVVKKPKEIGIIQPKEVLAPRCNMKYHIEVHLPTETFSSGFKMTPIGCAHQAIFLDSFDLNIDETGVYNRTAKLISAPEQDVSKDGITFSGFPPGMDPMSLEGKGPKEIHVGKEYQADVKNFPANVNNNNSNDNDGNQQRSFRLVKVPAAM